MNARQLEVFHAVMTCSGSLTKAARLLNVTQPSISVTLKHIEDQLGYALFKRESGRLTATPEARILFEDAGKIRAQLLAFAKKARSLRIDREGLLSIIVHPTLTSVLLEATTRYRKQRPTTRFLISSGTARQIAERTERGEFDLGLVYGSSSDSEEELIGYTEIVCAMRSDHALASRHVIETDDLLGSELIAIYKGSRVRDILDGSLEDQAVELNVKVEVTNYDAACLFAQEGPGIALVDSIIAKSGGYPGLVFKPLAIRPKVGLKLLQAQKRSPSKASLEFADLLKRIVPISYPGS